MRCLNGTRGIIVAALMFSLFFPLTLQPGTAAATTTPAAGLIVPLYSYPGSAWNIVVQEKQAYPAVRVVAVVNPGDGPGLSVDSSYSAGISNLKEAGVTVIGYVWTGYGARSISSIETDISKYKSFYGVVGVFLDQMTNVPGHESYYSTITTYAHSLGLSLVVGNAGTNVPSSFIGTVDTIIIFENSGIPSVSLLSSVTRGFARTSLAVISYDVPSVTSYSLTALANYAEYIYVTPATLPAPYSALPSYYSTVVADLNSLTSTLSVKSQVLGGNSFGGMSAVVIAPDGTVIASDFTSATIIGAPGVQYTVTAASYTPYAFSKWDNGAITVWRYVTLSGASTTVTAYYTISAAIMVSSNTLSGSSLKGMWTVVKSSSGSVTASGFTPFAFSGTAGDQYTVCVGNYGAHIFNHWDNGATSSCRTLQLSTAAWITATYS